jgi:hypothetical protein
MRRSGRILAEGGVGLRDRRSERAGVSAAPARVSCQMGPKPRSPTAPPSTGRKPPPTLGNQRAWRAGSERSAGRSGPGWNASCAVTAARTTGRRPACRGQSRSWPSTASGPRRCRTCARASCAVPAARSGPRPPVSPGWNRATPTAHLSPASPTRYRPGWAISGVHPPSTRDGIGHHEGRRMPGLPHADTREVCGGLAPPLDDEGRRRRGVPRRRRPSGLDHPAPHAGGHRQPTPGHAHGSMGRNPHSADP